ncbi:hypothetical protein RN001_001600 [Aquatica leii]|uniref:Transmembrane protein 222 n=1 Tax=Aquatica leii TaxID=1421715 RepID=A0AAN7SLC0_9COLE|nr:hypothetical protein RN001_001600 [Aquatica leii]
MYKSLPTQSDENMGSENLEIDPARDRFPFCVVWTPIPFLTWFIPIIGHMGIALSTGVIRDFAGPFYVGEDSMSFGQPTKYWQLESHKALGGTTGFDRAITEASDIYKNRVHNLCLDNCHSHVAMSLNLMHYNNSTHWNMFRMAFCMVLHSKYVSFVAFLKTWAPFVIITGTVVAITIFV